MKRTILTIILAVASAASAGASILDSLSYQARFGFHLGGTAPVGMPATIRSLDSYKIKDNMIVGIDAVKAFNRHWGMMVGLHYENKGMKTDARVKNYKMEMRRSGETLAGVFTGNVVTNVEQWMMTVPVLATYNVTPKLRLKAGPYLSLIMSNEFSGYAYDGYLRVGDPTGNKVELGKAVGERGDYDFSDDMRSWNVGIDVGLDWTFAKRLGLFADITWGLNSIFVKDFDTIEQRLYPIYGSLGLTYRLK